MQTTETLSIFRSGTPVLTHVWESENSEHLGHLVFNAKEGDELTFKIELEDGGYRQIECVVRKTEGGK